jgi:hypothetical protein
MKDFKKIFQQKNLSHRKFGPSGVTSSAAGADGPTTNGSAGIILTKSLGVIVDPIFGTSP